MRTTAINVRLTGAVADRYGAMCATSVYPLLRQKFYRLPISLRVDTSIDFSSIPRH